MTPYQIKQLAESQFEKAISAFGKEAYLTRLPDTSDIRSRFKKATGQDTYAHLPPNPADYAVTLNGKMFYAEVKGTDTDTFRFNRIEKSQLRGMIQQDAAKGQYYIFILHVGRMEWYCVPGVYFVRNYEKSMPITSIKLSNLQKEFGRGTDPLAAIY
jgi:penicillin-binding protein-related factor A (putative recombinase)